MCGFVGEIRLRDDISHPSRVEKAAARLHRRGPDDAGVWHENNVCLGHRRLAILDLSPAGHQPMVSDNGRFVVVYNGEIYNFLELRHQLDGIKRNWKSCSDTEVLLAAYECWGAGCLDRFHGMFAFAIWDRKENVLFAARDRMGVKPFYYHYSPNALFFSSRPRALFEIEPKLSRDLDYQALRLYLESGYIPAPYSIHTAVRKLPPAHYLRLKGAQLELKRYWNFATIQPESSWEMRPEDDLLDELEEIVSKSVKMRLISDVPLGAFLSGGIDSSLVIAMMTKHNAEAVKTFTIGFTENDYDESIYAKRVAEHLNTDHHCENLGIDDLLSLIDRFTEEYDEPFFDSSAFPTMAVSRMTRHFVTVSMSGDGGDELFGGYHYYQVVDKLSRLFHIPRMLTQTLAFCLNLLPKHELKLLANAIRQPNPLAMFAFSRSIEKDFGCVLTPAAVQDTFGLNSFFTQAAKAFPNHLSILDKVMRLDAMFTLPDDYLQKVDVATMAYSLESREPLLDHAIVEWAMKLPHTWKLKNGVNKYLLRKLSYRYVPKMVLDRPKMGFGVPIAKWLRGPLKDWAEERIEDKSLLDTLQLDQKAIKKLWQLHLLRKRNVHPLIWSILMLINFQSHYS